MGALGVVGCVCLAAGLVLGRAQAIAPALALVAAEYAVPIAIDADAIDVKAPLVAAGLLAAGELAAWSLELRAPIAAEAGAWWRRLALVLVEATAAYAIAATVLAVADAGGAWRNRDRGPRRHCPGERRAGAGAPRARLTDHERAAAGFGAVVSRTRCVDGAVGD